MNVSEITLTPRSSRADASAFAPRRAPRRLSRAPGGRCGSALLAAGDRRVWIAAAALGIAGSVALRSHAAPGPDWDEIGDAGSLPSNAQLLIGMGPVATIRGWLSLTDQQDMYGLAITEALLANGPLSFSATTLDAFGGSTQFASALWLFDGSGMGLLGTTALLAAGPGSGDGVFLGNASTDGTGIVITQPGFYYLAISGADSVPLGAFGLPIFTSAGSSGGGIAGPGGPGGLGPISGWFSGSAGNGEYLIALTSTAFVIPAPSALAALIVPAWLGHRRRRRERPQAVQRLDHLGVTRQ
ncbi:MAG TPA: hypothetical protein PKC43_10305 [Phycisphaerales bacterium]|nr:hypothetical protein [Phycisphaerales bacterium]HMP37828.1 hypothetical protein [Phycisphaerales bacterium]